jgi:transposase
MSKIKLVAIDLAKRCFQLGAIDEYGKILYNRKLSPAKFVVAIQQLEPTVIAMEACSGAHYWGRRLLALGHQVRLVPPQHAKAFRRVHKSDTHDVVSIAEAALRPNIHFVPVKSIAQQDLQLLGRIRERFGFAAHCDHQPDTRPGSRVRCELRKESRGTARTATRCTGRCRQRSLPDRSRRARTASSGCSAHHRATRTDHEAHYRSRIRRSRLRTTAHDPRHRPDDRSGFTRQHRTRSAVCFSSTMFSLGRLGAEAAQHRGHVQLRSITKNGDRSLRVLLIHGARTVVRWADKHSHAQSRWIRDLVVRRGKNKAIVALANKLMRIVWVVLTQGVEYDMHKAFRAQPL